MLRRDLIEVISSGRAWAFLGSGASVDAGGPTWRSLLDQVVRKLDGDVRQKVLDDGSFQVAVARREFPRAFGRIEVLTNRADLEERVLAETQNLTQPGPLSRLLTDLPFFGYLTTNYDSATEAALEEHGELGWAPVGNTPQEIRAVAGGSKLVWHIHGAASLPNDRSLLVITDDDFDAIYGEETPVIRQLRGLLTQHRIVFVGFGVDDPEFLRVLKSVGRLTTPARPLFAFLSSADDRSLDESRRDLLEKHNVDVIYYRVFNDSHAELHDLLNTYGSFSIRRSIQFGRDPKVVPSYAPETTALLLYDDLVMKGGARLGEGTHALLLRTRLIALLQTREPSRVEDLQRELEAPFSLIQGRESAWQQPADQIRAEIERLIAEGLAEAHEDGIRLSEAGRAVVADGAARSDLEFRRFSAAIRARAHQLSKLDDSAERIAQSAESFLRDCVKRRALGVALAFGSWSSDIREYQVTALMQALPDFMEGLQSREEAIVLAKVVLEVLSTPADVELNYLGLALQAQFGVHILGYDPDALRERIAELTETSFLVDSNTLIPFLAQSSWGHDAAKFLIDNLKEFGCRVATTGLLAEEVAEHARWAMKNLEPDGHLGTHTLLAASGRGGAATNAFLDGFLEEVRAGSTPDLLAYLARVLETGRGHGPGYRDICALLGQSSVVCYRFDEWDGFEQELYAERDELLERIGNVRRERDTFTHERQVKAEAEALLTIRSLRNGNFLVAGEACANAYFVSNTRILDELDQTGGLPITMRPDALLHWIGTLAPVSPEELGVFTSSLFGDLFQMGLVVVDERRLSMVFGPLISASEEDLEQERMTHRELLARLYGEEGLAAFDDLKPLDVPVVVQSVYRQRAEAAEAEANRERARRVRAEEVKGLTEEERLELERFKQRHAERTRKARKGERRATSRSRRRRGKGKRK